jgi:hypothetical protein
MLKVRFQVAGAFASAFVLFALVALSVASASTSPKSKVAA